jgi:hypothetical protein
MVAYYARMNQVVMPVAPVHEPVLVLKQNKTLTVRGFCAVKTGAAPRQDTRVALTWDRSGLEAVFSCSDADVVAEQRGPGNAKLWKDDSVYLWLDPGHSHNGRQAHVMIQDRGHRPRLQKRRRRGVASLYGTIPTFNKAQE